MRWREIDLDAATWTIAKERCKNGKAHTVDLSPEAVRMLDPLGDAPHPARSFEGRGLRFLDHGAHTGQRVLQSEGPN